MSKPTSNYTVDKLYDFLRRDDTYRFLIRVNMKDQKVRIDDMVRISGGVIEIARKDATELRKAFPSLKEHRSFDADDNCYIHAGNICCEFSLFLESSWDSFQINALLKKMKYINIS